MGRAPRSNAAVAGAASPRARVNLSAVVRTTSCIAGDTCGCEKVSPQISTGSQDNWQGLRHELVELVRSFEAVINGRALNAPEDAS